MSTTSVPPIDSEDNGKELNHRKLMDRIYRSQRHIYDATRKYFLLGRDELIADLDPPEKAVILELACGTGRNLIEIAKSWPNRDFYGVDISQEMLESASKSISRHGLSGSIKLVNGDASQPLDNDIFPDGGFDRIIISYSLSMIPDWRITIENALSALAPDGELHIVDFGQQALLPGTFRRILQWWLSRFHVEPRAELNMFIDGLSESGRFAYSGRCHYRDYCWRFIIRKM